jgi:hypothetical protein
LPIDPPPYPPPQGGRERRARRAPIVMNPALHCWIDLTKIGLRRWLFERGCWKFGTRTKSAPRNEKVCVIASEAIRGRLAMAAKPHWIASSLTLLAMTETPRKHNISPLPLRERVAKSSVARLSRVRGGAMSLAPLADPSPASLTNVRSAPSPARGEGRNWTPREAAAALGSIMAKELKCPLKLPSVSSASA